MSQSRSDIARSLSTSPVARIDLFSSSARQLARARQSVVEEKRLARHQRIALDLLTLPQPERARLIADALATVDRWKNEDLCSMDYIQKWVQILSLPPAEMAAVIVSDIDGWGLALRQNSPWVGVRA